MFHQQEEGEENENTEKLSSI
ncbi:hypothetical protein BSG1_10603 [Bacillus sp. SG-1]|nr:hypothetical protein BSG1_10603 [Bacillus sp. SG-1]